MSAVTKTRCKAIRQLIQRATDAATSLSEAGPPTLSPSASRGHLLKLCKVHLALLEAIPKLSNEQLASDHTTAEHLQFISGFTTLVAALAPLLISLDTAAAASTASPQCDLFSKLWEILLAGCQAFNTWPEVWEASLASCAALHSALDSLTAWLLPATRNPTSAWASLHLNSTLVQKTRQALCILTVPLTCFVSITSQPSLDRTRALDFIYDLPPGFVDTVCCLVCEQLGSSLPNVMQAAKRAVIVEAAAAAPTAASSAPPAESHGRSAVEAAAERSQQWEDSEKVVRFFFYMATSIGCFINCDYGEESSTLLNLLAVPSVLQLFKAAVSHHFSWADTLEAEGWTDDSREVTSVYRTMVRSATGVEQHGRLNIMHRTPGSTFSAHPRTGRICGPSGKSSPGEKMLQQQAGGSVGGSSCSGSSAGSTSSEGSSASATPAQPSPPHHLTTPTLTSDIQLFRSLRGRMLLDTECTRTGLCALEAVYDRWNLSSSCELPALHLTHQIGALNQLAHTCIIFTLMHMRNQLCEAHCKKDSGPPQLCTYSLDRRLAVYSKPAMQLDDDAGMFGLVKIDLTGNLMLRAVSHGLRALKLRSNGGNGRRGGGGGGDLLAGAGGDAGTQANTQQQQQQQQQREQREQQQQRIDNHPDLHMLHTWIQMPASVTALEALIRSSHAIVSYGNMHQFAKVAVDLLVANASNPEHADMLPACISLAATVQKLLHPLCHTSSPGSSQGERAVRREKMNQQESGGPGFTSDTRGALLVSLSDGLTTLDTNTTLYAVGSPGLRNYSCSSWDYCASGGSFAASHLSPADEASRLLRDVATLSGEGTQVSAQGVIMYPFASRRAQLVYQLQAILMACLVPLCHLRVLETEEQDPRSWLTPLATKVGQLKSRLAAVGTLLLSERTMMSDAREGLLPWCLERFGLTIFDGRLVPGCCHLGCESLEGVSEASLRTWLCKGCRRARYCSLECQKQAWASVHYTVCRRSMGLRGSFV